MKKTTLCLLAAALPLLSAAAAPDTIFNQVDENGLKQGFWQKAYPNGKVAYRTFFMNDKPLGLLMRYHENGVKMALIDYFDGGGEAIAQLFSTKGELEAEGRYVGGNRKQGLWKYYRENLLVMDERYENGQLEGSTTLYHADGRVYERKRFKNNLQEGVYEQLDAQGNLTFEMLYARGLPHGKVRYYYPNGQPRIEGSYANGLRSGKWTFYDPNGEVERKATYVDGTPNDQDVIDKKTSDILKSMEASRGQFIEPLNPDGED
jgi:antitoxin component YwqK of YwqJK toxin-antitoxin module